MLVQLLYTIIIAEFLKPTWGCSLIIIPDLPLLSSYLNETFTISSRSTVQPSLPSYILISSSSISTTQPSSLHPSPSTSIQSPFSTSLFSTINFGILLLYDGSLSVMDDAPDLTASHIGKFSILNILDQHLLREKERI